MNTKCVKCGGTLRAHRDLDGTVAKCLMCGKEYPIVNEAPARQSSGGDYKAGLRLRLEAILGMIEDQAGLMREAEAICKALEILGETPRALPWKASKSKATTPAAPRSYTPRTYPVCGECGLQFTNTIQYQRTADGAVCRDKAVCNVRKAAAA